MSFSYLFSLTLQNTVAPNQALPGPQVSCLEQVPGSRSPAAQPPEQWPDHALP